MRVSRSFCVIPSLPCSSPRMIVGIQQGYSCCSAPAKGPPKLHRGQTRRHPSTLLQHVSSCRDRTERGTSLTGDVAYLGPARQGDSRRCGAYPVAVSPRSDAPIQRPRAAGRTLPGNARAIHAQAHAGSGAAIRTPPDWRVVPRRGRTAHAPAPVAEYMRQCAAAGALDQRRHRGRQTLPCCASTAVWRSRASAVQFAVVLIVFLRVFVARPTGQPPRRASRGSALAHARRRYDDRRVPGRRSHLLASPGLAITCKNTPGGRAGRPGARTAR